MKRREFLLLISFAVGTWVGGLPRVLAEERMRRIGVLLGRSPADSEGKAQVQAFEQGLAQFGWLADRNIAIEYRWTGGDPERTRALAKELVGQRPEVIVGQTSAIVKALLDETRATPIVFVAVNDPIGSGFITSLSNPGGNASGLVDLEPSLGGKWVNLLKEVTPRLARVHCLFNPETAPGAGSYYLRSVEQAANSLGLESIPQPVRDTEGIEKAIGAAAGAPDGGLIVMPDIFNGINRQLIVATTARQRVPAIYAFRFFATAGGLMSYGVDLLDLYRRAAGYTDKILKGVKVADLPVQLPIKFELVLNLNAAKGLGIDFSPALAAQADEVIG